jgi:3-dehydroquinate dehydratase-1
MTGGSKICVALGNISRSEALSILKFEELCELRLDLMPEAEPIEELVKAGAKCIATCRENQSLTESKRRALLLEAVEAGVYAVDLDIGDKLITDLSPQIKKSGAQLILSHHDFAQTPLLSELISIREAAFKMGADVFKLATQVNSDKDAARLLFLLEDARKQVVIGMGELGKITRIAAPFLGSLFTYVSPPNSKTAPGQLEADELRSIWSTIEKSLKEHS